MRTLARLMVMVLLALLIAACGDEDDGGDATEEATTVSNVATETTEEPTEEATDPAIASESTPVGVSNPASMATPAAVASPVGSVASPDVVASPAAGASPVAMATPAENAVAAPVGAGSGAATPAGDGAALVTLRGEVTLPGTAGETFVIAGDGCVGLNGYSDMRAGRQLVVRDETGTIIGVTEIEASDATDTCSWTFALDVPVSDFYAVSIPMEVERIYTQDEVEQSGGEVTVPLG